MEMAAPKDIRVADYDHEPHFAYIRTDSLPARPKQQHDAHYSAWLARSPKMATLSLKDFKKIHPDYRGVWSDAFGEKPEWKGRRTCLSGCISGLKMHYLAIEGVDFEITA